MAAERGGTRPRLLLFDVNETLLDLAPLRATVGACLGDEGLVPLWFTTLLQHTLVATVADRYRGFDEIGAAALLMLARARGIDLDEEEARRVASGLTRLPPHPDVAGGLAAMRDAGLRLAALTNSTRDGLAAQMEHAGLTDRFEALISVEEVGLYKPHGHVYRWAARRMGLDGSDCMMVAAHGWDVAGAAWAGLRTAFVARPGRIPYPLGPEPEITEPDLRVLADRLVAMADPDA